MLFWPHQIYQPLVVWHKMFARVYLVIYVSQQAAGMSVCYVFFVFDVTFVYTGL